MTRRVIFLPFVALLGVAAIFAACGDDDDDSTSTPAVTTAAATATSENGGAPTEAEATTFVEEELIGNFNAGDLNGFLAAFSDDGLLALVGADPGTTRAEAEQAARENLTAGEITKHSITKKSSAADSITVNVVTDNGQILQSEDFTVGKGDDGLIVTAYERLEPDIPSDLTKIAVEGTEFQYITDTSGITDNKIAFEFSNIGSQFHELYLLQIDETTPVQQIVDEILVATSSSQNIPASVLKDLGPVVAPPGVSSNYIPASPLDSGRYLMICFIPDQAVPEDEAEPHGAKGMFKDFTIP